MIHGLSFHSFYSMFQRNSRYPALDLQANAFDLDMMNDDLGMLNDDFGYASSNNDYYPIDITQGYFEFSFT